MQGYNAKYRSTGGIYAWCVKKRGLQLQSICVSTNLDDPRNAKDGCWFTLLDLAGQMMGRAGTSQHPDTIPWGRVTSPPPVFATKNFTICILYFWFESSSSPWRQWTVHSSFSWYLKLRSSRRSHEARLPPAAAVADTIFVEDNDTRHL